MRQACATIILGLATVVATAFAGPAAAADWRLSPAESRIEFVYRADGVAEAGRFERFEGRGAFDAARPEDASLSLVIEIDSIDLDDGFRTNFVKTETWFDVDQHPRATFSLNRLTPIGEDRYRAAGVLRIKGIEREIDMDLALRISGDRAEAVGEASFNRFDFRVGDRAASLFIDIDDMVGVRFQLVARRS